MDFKEWFYTEVRHIDSMAVDNIILQPIMDGYQYNFELQGKKYEVTFTKDFDLEYQHKKVPGSYTILFSGPNLYHTTNQEGYKAPAIYTQLLLAIKKLFSIELVNGLSFHANEPAMQSVYRKFFKQFLQSDFIQVNNTEYIKKSFIREILQDQPERAKKTAYQKILSSHRELLTNLQQQRQQKAHERKLRLYLPRLVGKVVYVSERQPAFVIKADNLSFTALVWQQGKIEQQRFAGTKLDLSSVPSETEIQNLKNYIHHSPYRHLGAI